MNRPAHYLALINSIYLITLILIIIVVPKDVEAQDQWQKYNSPAEDFYILCPGGLMQYKFKEIKTVYGESRNEVHYLKMEGDHPNSLYMVNKITYPKEFEALSNEIGDSLLLESLSGLALSNKAEIKYHNVEYKDEYTSIVSRLEQESDTSIKVKGYLLGNQLYFLQVYTPHENKINDFIERFMSSFHYK